MKTQTASWNIVFLPSISTLYASGWSTPRHAPVALPPRKSRHPLHRRIDGPQDRSGRVRKISLPLGFDPRTVQPVAGRYPGPLNNLHEYYLALFTIRVDTCSLKLVVCIQTIKRSWMICTAGGTTGEQERCMQGLGDETCGKETTWKT
jgi:hypothetical protein